MTGNQASNIDGTIRSTIPDSNFFLINPAGIAFGPNASLDVPGSVNISTADEITFPDGGSFSATDPSSSILSVASPEAFGFTNPRPASISIEHSDLAVSEGASLRIVGGDVSIEGPGGDVAEIGVESARSFITLQGGDLQIVARADRCQVSLSPVPPQRPADGFGSIVIRDTNVDLSAETAGGALFIGDTILFENSWLSAYTGDASEQPHLSGPA